MAGRKKKPIPKIIVVQSQKEITPEPVWEQVGPILAGILVNAIKRSSSASLKRGKRVMGGNSGEPIIR